MNGVEIYGKIYQEAKKLNFIYIEELKFGMARFLFVRPLSQKENVIFKSLKEKKKLPYLTKLVIKEYLKQGHNKNFIDAFYENKRMIRIYKNSLEYSQKEYHENFNKETTEFRQKLNILLKYTKNEENLKAFQMSSRTLFKAILQTVIQKLYKDFLEQEQKKL